MPTDHEHLTDVELAADIYLGMIALDDELPDSVMAQLPVKKAAALWARISGPYCKVEGCGKPRTASFPWCAEHLAQNVGGHHAD